MSEARRHGPIKLGEFHVTTFAPPHRFNARTATERELLVAGYPPRPHAAREPDLHAKWLRAYDKPLIHIVPHFTLHPNVVHGQSQASPRQRVNANSSNNWSGAIVTAPPGDSFQWVSGAWTVPAPRPQPGRCDGNTYYSSTWIGIDGAFGSTDVLQAGTQQDQTCVNGKSQPGIYAWWEWYPLGEVAIDNFPVAAGDVMSCLICASSTTAATIYLTNQTNNHHTAFAITAPSGTALVGNCAEWIYERTGLIEPGGTLLRQLADCGEVDFFECWATTRAMVTMNANAGAPVVMNDDFCDTYATGSITGAQAVRAVYGNPSTPPMFAAWKGINDDQGIYWANFNGAFFMPQQKVPGAGTSVGPALAMFRERAFMAWKGVDDDKGIYWSQFGDGWAGQQNVPGVGTAFRPALAAYNDELFMAWRGVNDDKGIYWATFDGNGWSGQQNVPGVGASGDVALATFGNRLFMAWKGINNDQGIYWSSYDGRSWSPQQQVPNVGTSFGPSLAVFNGRLFMAWKGVDGDQGIYWSSFDGRHWAGQQIVPGMASSTGPALTVLKCKLFMMWKGVEGDQRLYFSTFDGSKWNFQQNVINVGSSLEPAIAS